MKRNRLKIEVYFVSIWHGVQSADITWSLEQNGIPVKSGSSFVSRDYVVGSWIVHLIKKYKR